MVRTYDITLPGDTSWLADADAQAVCQAIEAGGHRIYFVGGCVRNALLGLPDSDVDMSTDALPERVMALARGAGLKAVPTGVEHGTVTVVSGGKGFEVTTFRRDVETDGRHAVVVFSDNIGDDARRRDFTMNALYADAEGRVIDPLEGMADLRARRVRFIEDADARIREDYLRTLRFFRFCAWYSDPAEGFDADALSAIASNTDGLETLSAERVGAEMQKILRAPDPAPALAAMRQTGVLGAVLPGSDDRWIAMLVHFETLAGVPVTWLWRLAALGGEGLADRLRLSKADARDLDRLKDAAFEGKPLAELAYRYGEKIAQGAWLLRACIAETSPDLHGLETIHNASKAVFPIKSADLMPDYSGPALGKRIKQLEAVWIASGFAADRATLLDTPDS
ncbi:MAG: CCA tRNA nucleotidyltransferase [Sulfitobacter sp.]|nr:CCA tRNA nucleotidyltransferase [Sulfitobacter sp.]